MASDLLHKYSAHPDIDQSAVRDALNDLTDDDISVSSPITAGAPEASVGVERGDDMAVVEVTVSGHSGDWSKTSEQAVTDAVEAVEGVVERADAEGGYEPDG
jgi:hypothetical protein